MIMQFSSESSFSNEGVAQKKQDQFNQCRFHPLTITPGWNSFSKLPQPQSFYEATQEPHQQHIESP